MQAQVENCKWTPDDWETPDKVAYQMAAMIAADERVILEPSAGSGQIAQYLPPGAICVEKSVGRFRAGRHRCPDCEWHRADFLGWCEVEPVDVVIGNPPFSLWAEFLSQSLDLLAPAGRVLFLGPCDQFHKPTFLAKLSHPVEVTAHPVVGRVAYLKEGVPHRGRQIYDSIFEIRRAA